MLIYYSNSSRRTQCHSNIKSNACATVPISIFYSFALTEPAKSGMESAKCRVVSGGGSYVCFVSNSLLSILNSVSTLFEQENYLLGLINSSVNTDTHRSSRPVGAVSVTGPLQ